MPTIPLTDQFGLNLNAQPADTSALLKYAQQLPSLQLKNLDLKKIGGLTLDQPALTSLSTGVAFEQPLTLGDGAPALSIGAGVTGSLQLLRDAADLPGHGHAIDLSADQCYVVFEIDAAASAGVSATSGVFEFGATPSTEVEVASYCRFPLKTGMTLADAVRQTVAAFSLPLRSGDLAGLAAGQITRVAVSGKLTVSGSADLLAVTNPLASAKLPAPLPAVAVSAGGSATVGVSCAISAKYEIVARKLDNGAVRLGWYRQKDTEFSVSAQASEGVSATVGSTEVFSRLISLISANPSADLTELSKAGVPGDQAAAIAAAVNAAASRKAEIAVAAELSSGDMQSVVFLFEIHPSLLTDAGKKAVDQALRGNLTGLHAGALAGITPVRSIWDRVRQRGLELDVNLCGILNYRSVTTLCLEGKVLYEPATGALAITDTATAERIRSTQVNFGADLDKLRHVLAESFLITAAYRAARVVEGASLRASHSFFELQQSARPGDVLRNLSTGVALGLLPLSERKVPNAVADFGRTLFSVTVEYDNDLVRHMFLDSGGNPLPRETYERAGRDAIQFLVQAGDADAVRRRPATEDDLWTRMKAVGQPGFGGLLPGVPDPLLGAIRADYSSIQWWADTMRATAEQLAEVEGWIGAHPGVSASDLQFQQRREELAAYLGRVAADTREEFGQPWGLIAMNQLAGRRAGARLQITASSFAISLRRALSVASPGALDR